MKKQHGFTLAEILIMLVILGVISTLSISVLSMQKAKFGLNCYYLLRELQLTVGSMAAQTDEGTLISKITEPQETTDENGTVTNTEETKYDLSSDSDFCKFLANSLNSASTLNCSDGDLFNATTSSIYGGISSNSTPNFRLVNKYSFYISKHVTGGKTAAGEVKPGYRMLAVDLNGDGKPNATDDDIIAFAIFDNGAILPYGVAATNERQDKNGKTEYVPYFSTVIKGRNLVSSSVSLSEDESLSKVSDSSLSWMYPSVIIRNPDSGSSLRRQRKLSFKDSYCKVYADEITWYDSSYCTGYTTITNDWTLTLLTTKNSTEEEREYSVTKCGKYCGETNCYDDEETWYSHSPNTDPLAIIECSCHVIKPKVSNFIPIMQDVYHAHYGKDSEDNTVSQSIYKF